jgi:hypothetical protein
LSINVKDKLVNLSTLDLCDDLFMGSNWLKQQKRRRRRRRLGGVCERAAATEENKLCLADMAILTLP